METITKELLYKSVYREIYFYADKKMIEMGYLKESSNYTDEEYKKEEVIFSNLLLEKNVEICYTDTVHFDYIITPKIQEWVKEVANLF